MGDVVSPDGVAKGGRLALVGKLGGVDPDDGQGLGVFRFQRLQLREDVQAVDSAVGPEVEEHHAPAKVAKAKRPGDIEPLHPFRKLGRVDGGTCTKCHSGPPNRNGAVSEHVNRQKAMAERMMTSRRPASSP